MIRITAKHDGFRRAGLAHAGTRDYPEARFTAAQLAALQAEPLLYVEVLPEPAPAAPVAPAAPDPEAKAAKGGKQGQGSKAPDDQAQDGAGPAQQRREAEAETAKADGA